MAADDRVVREFPELEDVVAHLMTELMRRRPAGFYSAVVVGAVLFGDPATGANEWATAFASAATITTPMAEILASCEGAIHELAQAEAARERQNS